MGKKHKKDIGDVSMEEEDNLQPQATPEQSSKKIQKNKKIRKREETIEVKIETINGSADKSLPLIGYFPSGYDPEKSQREEPRVRVLKHVKRTNRLQLVVSPNQSSQMNFIGTNYSGEGLVPQVCSYALGVLDKETQTLKIVQIEANKIFRLEPNFGDQQDTADEAVKEVDNKVTVEDTPINHAFDTSKSERKAKKQRALFAKLDPEAQEDLNNKMTEAKVNKKALEGDATIATARNIPPHDTSATIPQQAYPLQKIIFKGEWRYLLDIMELLQQGKNITPEAYPVFICNRIHMIEEAKDDVKESLACVFSYINHLIKTKDKHSLDGFSSAKHHKLPSILTQKFSDMFGTDSKRLADDKRNLLISYVLVLTLFADNFKTEFSDIAKDLRMSTGDLRHHFELLGCKFIRENNIMLATLPVPLKFPEVRIRRRSRR